MRSVLAFITLATFTAVASAQSKNPTTTKGVQDKINQAQQQIDQLTPEQRKMMEQMGFSTKVPSLPAGTTDAQVAVAVGGDGIPRKNTALMAAIPQVVISSATLPAYLKTLDEYIQKTVPNAYMLAAQNIYSALKKNKYTSQNIGNTAIGLWIDGDLETAVCLIDKACAGDASDADLLSNFATMLSMAGAPHKAIPLLEYLNKQYPDNTTILNNLGQAWFYLGDVEKADAQLQKVVRAFAYHPQANYTQCLIQESKGNKTQAIEKIKNSLRYSYSLDKVNKLRKLGYSVKGSDMRIPFRPDPDPLGLRKFVRPDVPASYEDELKLIADWDAFQKQTNEKSIELAKSLIPYQNAAVQQAQQAYNKDWKANISALSTTDAAATKKLYYKTAEKNLEEMNKDGGAGFRLKKAKAEIDALLKDFTAKDEIQRKSIEKGNSIRADRESELAKKGENIGFDNCVVQRKYSEWVYTNYNKPLEQAYQNYLHQLRLKITEELYWKQFTQDDVTFEATKIQAKNEWLAAIGSSRYIATNRYGKCEAPENKGSRYKLADFDEMHCQYISILDFGVYKQVVECGKMHVEFDAGKVSGQLNFKSDNQGKDHLSRSSIEATLIDKDISIKKGPLEIGASVKAGMGIEFSGNGIEDVYVTAEAAASAKSNIIKTFDEHISEANTSGTEQPGMSDAQFSDKGVEIGVSGKMSLISGNTSTNIFVNTPNK